MPKKFQGLVDVERKDKFISDLQQHSAISGTISETKTVTKTFAIKKRHNFIIVIFVTFNM